jgi:membrane protein YqaA with SNARE-associated domain
VEREKMKRQTKTLEIIGTIVTLIFISTFIASIAYQDELSSYINGEAKASGYFFILLASAILELIPQLIAPTWIMINAAILNLPLVTTTAFIIIGSTIGAGTGYILGRKYGIKFARRMFGRETMSKTAKLFNSHGRWFVALAALTPLPYLTIVFGAIGMSPRNIVLFGLLPRAISYVILYTMIILGISIFWSF